MTKTTKRILIAAGVAVVLTAGILGYNKWRDNRNAKKATQPPTPEPDPDNSGTTTNTYTPPAPVVLADGTFPLMASQKSKLVQKMQQALIKKQGNKYITSGATGLFGGQTAAALTAEGYDGATISEAEYNVILQGKNKQQQQQEQTLTENANKTKQDLIAQAIAKSRKDLPIGTMVQTLRTVTGLGLLKGSPTASSPSGWIPQSVYNKTFNPSTIIGRVADYHPNGLGVIVTDFNKYVDATGLNKTGLNLGYRVAYFIPILNADNKLNVQRADGYTVNANDI